MGIPRNTGRLSSIDTLRFVAVLLVMFAHFPLVGVLARGGWIGVDLFFVLSGFLIGSLLVSELEEHETIDVRRFLVRRGLKIYPIFYLYVATAVASRLLAGGSLRLRDVLGDMFFLQNYIGSIFEHTWSLGVEEHFYLSAPFLVAGAARRGLLRPQVTVAAVAAISLVLLGLRFATYQSSEWAALTHHYPTHLRIDALLVGVALAVLLRTSSKFRDTLERRGRRLLLPALVVLLFPFAASIDSLAMNTLQLAMMPYSFAVVVAFAVVRHDARILTTRAMRLLSTLGRASYATYLWHIIVRNLVQRGAPSVGLDENGTLTFALFVVASFALGIAVTKAVEAPVLAFRDRVYQTRSTVKLL